MTLQMKASILINNYNYGRYLRQCINSARAQTYEDLEVVVVDDGSDDDSADIINSYGDQIIPVLKKNGGQASCFNAGFERSQGDIIFLLDADDVFQRDKVAIVMNIYHSLNVEWCFDVVDQSGIPAKSAPILDRDICVCDYRASIARGTFPDLPAPTSGLSFRRRTLSKILPMPVACGIALSDNYLKFASSGLAPGAICRVPLTYQRIHNTNRYTKSEACFARQSEIRLTTGVQLARQFPPLSAIAIKLVSAAIAERIVLSLAHAPVLLTHWRRSPFTFLQKMQILFLSAVKIARIRFRQATATGREGG
jgi:glycosyltransferase involved in cell wall biosynthesis